MEVTEHQTSNKWQEKQQIHHCREPCKTEELTLQTNSLKNGKVITGSDNTLTELQNHRTDPLMYVQLLRKPLSTPATKQIRIGVDEFQAYSLCGHLHDFKKHLLLHRWSPFVKEHVCQRSWAALRKVIYWSNLNITLHIDDGLDKDTGSCTCLYTG